MKRVIILLATCMSGVLLSSCSGGEDIPKESANETEAQEEIMSNSDVGQIDSQALSIKEAAAQAVKIIEDDAQAEIDTIKAELAIEPSNDVPPQESKTE